MPKGGLHIKRIYAGAAPGDGARILVDRLWPRGIKKEDAGLTAWLKEVAPTTELRRAFHGGEMDWDEFCRRYRAELEANPEPVARLHAYLREGPVTLLYAAQNETRNHAAVLAEYLRHP